MTKTELANFNAIFNHRMIFLSVVVVPFEREFALLGLIDLGL